jgi:hypothetical protein
VGDYCRSAALDLLLVAPLRCATAYGVRKDLFLSLPSLSLRSVWDKSQTYHSLQRASALRAALG